MIPDYRKHPTPNMHIFQQVTPVLINGCNVMDFGFDPFDGRRLAVACNDGSGIGGGGGRLEEARLAWC